MICLEGELEKMKEEVARTANCHLSIWYAKKRERWVVSLGPFGGSIKVEGYSLLTAVITATSKLITYRKKYDGEYEFTL
jgi:hypothetical protein